MTILEENVKKYYQNDITVQKHYFMPAMKRIN